MLAGAAAGHRKFLLKRRPGAAKQGINVSSPGSARFAAQGHERKEAFGLS